MLKLFEAISEGFKLATTLVDADKRREAYELALDKQARKALNLAESIIFEVADEMEEDMSYQIRKRYKYLKKKFFELN